MRLKTALKAPSFIEGVFEYVDIIGGDERKFYFECRCGREFSLSTEYDIYRHSQLRCAECKRTVAPDIGERAVFKRVKSDANRAGRTFNLPFDWFKHVIHASCHYCGRTDGNKISVPSKTSGRWLIRNFRYNGIDRLDNNVGYEVQNCVPCCFICNRAKQSMPYTEFVQWINDMIQYRGNQIRG